MAEEYICAHCGAHRQGDPDRDPCGCWSPEQEEKNRAAMSAATSRSAGPGLHSCGAAAPLSSELVGFRPPLLRQNVIRYRYVVTLRRPDGSRFQRTIHAESLAAAKLCAQAVAEEEHAKVAYITTAKGYPAATSTLPKAKGEREPPESKTSACQGA